MPGATTATARRPDVRFSHAGREPRDRAACAPRTRLVPRLTGGGLRARRAAGARDGAAAVSAPADRPRRLLLKRTAMVAATAFLSINLWTGAPLLALWVG